jgi:capsid protein
MATQLLDGFGRPITSTGGGGDQIYDLPSRGDGLRIPPPSLAQDIAYLLSRHKHRLLISDSRYIAETFPLVAGAIQQKADYVTQAGLTPHFTGRDHTWGRTARAALAEAHKIINVRGPQYDWDRSWHIGCTMFDIDGDFFVLLGESPDGFPQLQFLEGHRVGCRYGERLVTTGTYTGLTILNGVIYNARGRAVAYRILGSEPDRDRDVSARDVLHCAIPRWFSDGRPVPTLTHSILDWYDVKETRGYQRTKQKINSALTLIEATPTGGPSAATVANSTRAWTAAATAAAAAGQPLPPRPGTDAAPITEQLAGGLIRYIKAGAGSITTHGDNTPSDQWMRFDERIVQGAFYGMGWRSEMLDLSKLSGAPTRGFQDQINTTIFQRWKDLRAYAARADLYILAKLIKRGDLPAHPEWMQWDYTPPADFTVDGGRAAKADLDNVRAGADSMPAIIGRFGRTAEEVLRDQAAYLRLRGEIEKEEGLPPGSLGTLAQPGAPVPAADADADATPPPAARAA